MKWRDDALLSDLPTATATTTTTTTTKTTTMPRFWFLVRLLLVAGVALAAVVLTLSHLVGTRLKFDPLDVSSWDTTETFVPQTDDAKAVAAKMVEATSGRTEEERLQIHKILEVMQVQQGEETNDDKIKRIQKILGLAEEAQPAQSGGRNEGGPVLSLQEEVAQKSDIAANALAVAMGARHEEESTAEQADASADGDAAPTKAAPGPVQNGAVFTLSPALSCSSRAFATEPRVEMRGSKFWVLYNYIRPSRKFECNETVTYTTHGQAEFLDNLEPLLERWQGPVSVSVYCPGNDYERALEVILYLRECSLRSSLVKELVTFHLFFDVEHVPMTNLGKILSQDEISRRLDSMSCDLNPFESLNSNGTLSYRDRKNLDYPVNVARNVARETAASHFVFASDIELYPSPGMIPAFLAMIRRNEKPLSSATRRRRVFVSSIFEIEAGVDKLPETKTQLVTLMKKGTVVPFHHKLCPYCHSIPAADQWKKKDLNTTKLRVFKVAKRTGRFQHWEPIYIGTHEDPLYDERLSWEGRSDKMTQGFQLCVLDYDFHILSTSFLLHKPGIKTTKPSRSLPKKVIAQNTLIKNKISKELRALYGNKKGCKLLN